MTSFGQTLRNAREAKGLTCSQVAAQTHMLVQTVEEMEKEDFHRIPAPIYGRGFVRLFAECVGLDPVPLVREFMDIYEGRRAPTVRPRPVPPAPEPVAAPPPAPLPEPEPVPAPEPEPDVSAPAVPEEEDPEPFAYPPPASLEPDPPAPAPQPVNAVPDVIDPFAAAPAEPVPEPVAEPAAEPVAPPPPPPPTVPEQPLSVRGLDLFDPPPAASVPPPAPAAEPPHPYESPYLSSSAYEAGPSAAERFRRSLSTVSHNVVSTWNNIPRRTWRIAALAAAGLLVLALLVWGCRKLYEATTPSAPPPPPAAAAPAVTPPPPAAAKPAKPAGPVKLRSTGQKIPPLYAD